MATDDKKSSFLDRLSGKVSEGFKANPGDAIHEGISDDELDKLLAGDILSSSRPPTNPSGPAEYVPSTTESNTSSVLADAVKEDSSTTDNAGMTTERVADALNSSVINSVAQGEQQTPDIILEKNEPVDLVIEASTTEEPSLSDPIEVPTFSGVDLSGLDAKTNSFSAPNQTSAETELSVDVTSSEDNTATTQVIDIVTPDSEPAEENVQNTELNVVDALEINDDAIDTNSTLASANENVTDLSEVNDVSSDTNIDTPEVSANTAVVLPASLSTDIDKTQCSDEQKNTNESTKIKSTTAGNNTMTDQNQLEKIQSDIDELKRKIHAMSSEYFTAATDSASLIAEVRELDSSSSDDFTGTYSQIRDLRKLLIDARKLFTQLPINLDMLEEALENDLYAAKK